MLSHSVEEGQDTPARANCVLDTGVAEGGFRRLNLTAEAGCERE